jgi:hypothetical protein
MGILRPCSPAHIRFDRIRSYLFARHARDPERYLPPGWDPKVCRGGSEINRNEALAWICEIFFWLTTWKGRGLLRARSSSVWNSIHSLAVLKPIRGCPGYGRVPPPPLPSPSAAPLSPAGRTAALHRPGQQPAPPSSPGQRRPGRGVSVSGCWLSPRRRLGLAAADPGGPGPLTMNKRLLVPKPSYSAGLRVVRGTAAVCGPVADLPGAASLRQCR